MQPHELLEVVDEGDHEALERFDRVVALGSNQVVDDLVDLAHRLRSGQVDDRRQVVNRRGARRALPQREQQAARPLVDGAANELLRRSWQLQLHRPREGGMATGPTVDGEPVERGARCGRDQRSFEHLLEGAVGQLTQLHGRDAVGVEGEAARRVDTHVRQAQAHGQRRQLPGTAAAQDREPELETHLQPVQIDGAVQAGGVYRHGLEQLELGEAVEA